MSRKTRAKTMFGKMLSFAICVVCVGPVCAVKLDVGSCSVRFSEKCEPDAVDVYLFASDRPDESVHLNGKNLTLPDWIDLSRTNKLLVHGYGGNLEFFATKIIRNAYLRMNDTNVFVVDWGRLASLPCYPAAAINTKYAAKCAADLLMKLEKRHASTFRLDEMHGVGFSLGAHFVSFLSNRMFKTNGKKLQRITGLDPALPFFATNAPSQKLDATDAHFVDVIHTNAGYFGKIEPSGHLDFYINGGQSQPACSNHKNGPLCSHILSTMYFAESINSDVGFWGIRCHNYIQYVLGWCSARSTFPIFDRILMGEHSIANLILSVPMVVFVETNVSTPYALGFQ